MADNIMLIYRAQLLEKASTAASDTLMQSTELAALLCGSEDSY